VRPRRLSQAAVHAQVLSCAQVVGAVVLAAITARPSTRMPFRVARNNEPSPPTIGQRSSHPSRSRRRAWLADACMASLFAMLDRLPFVQRYAWFTDDCWNHPDCRFGSLSDARGRLSSPGRVFEAAR